MITPTHKNAMFGIANQKHIRGSLTTSYTSIEENGKAEATVLLAQNIFALIDSLNRDKAATQIVDDLDLETLAEKAVSAASSLPDFEGGPMTEAELGQYYKRLRDVEVGNATPAARTFRDCVAGVLDERFSALSQAFQRVFDEVPSQVIEAADDCRKRLEASVQSDPVLKHLPTLGSLLRTANELSEYEDELTPKTYDRAQQALHQESQREAEAALREIVGRRMSNLLREGRARVDGTLKEFEKTAERFRCRVSAVIGQLSEDRKDRVNEEGDRLSSVSLSLPGPDKDQVLMGMKAACSCVGLAELTVVLARAFTLRLRETAQNNCPHIDWQAASTPTLMLEVGALAVTQAINETIQDNLASGHSPYELVDAYGVSDIVDQLYERAAPTCSFSGRDCEALGVTPDELLVVRLAKAHSAEDELVRRRLEKAFQERNQKCTFCEGGDDEKNIYVSRVHAGWPIGIETTNTSLLMSYVRAGDDGHIPHLIGFIPDSPLGRAFESAREILDNAISQTENHDEESQTKPQP